MPTETDTPGNIGLLYAENARHHRFAVELRHKLALRYFLAALALTVISGWLIESSCIELKQYLWMPCELVAVLAVIFFFMERRNTAIINACKAAGLKLEKMLHPEGGVYVAAKEGAKNTVPYGFLLMALYIIAASVSFLLGLLVFYQRSMAGA